MKVWKQLALCVLLVGVAGGGYYAFAKFVADAPQENGRSGRRGNAAPVIVAQVETQRIEDRVEAVGTTRASRAVEIVPLASGRVVELAFQSGQKVDKGDILLSLDDEIEKANLSEADAKLKQAKLMLERSESLRRNNTVSQAQTDQLAADYVAAEANRDRAARRLADRDVRAPFEGVVGLRRVDVGARVDDDTVITTLDDLSNVEVEFQLPELFYDNVRRGLVVSASSAAVPDKTFTGEIANIDSRIDENARAFRVRAVIPNPDLALPSGMFMTISVVLDSREAVVIPEAAIIMESSTAYVFIVEDGKAVRREIAVGERRRDIAEVTSGLEIGQLVIQRGTQNVRDGSPVAILEPDAAPASPSDAGGQNS